MNYPLYIQRGQKIIPLTKKEIQEELDSMSYRKIDVEQPYEKKNIFNNIGENIHRKPDEQKWYDVIQNQQYKSVGMPPQTKWENQKGIIK
jgi:ABC-type microcin C transport system permease subunit YejE